MLGSERGSLQPPSEQMPFAGYVHPGPLERALAELIAEPSTAAAIASGELIIELTELGTGANTVTNVLINCQPLNLKFAFGMLLFVGGTIFGCVVALVLDRML